MQRLKERFEAKEQDLKFVCLEEKTMPIELSCGAVVISREDGETRYLLIANPSGIWGFPKGHMEAGETERETALREIKEETGLDVQFLGDFRAADAHALVREGRPDVTKQITYFLAEYRAILSPSAGGNIRYSPHDLSGSPGRVSIRKLQTYPAGSGGVFDRSRNVKKRRFLLANPFHILYNERE